MRQLPPDDLPGPPPLPPSVEANAQALRKLGPAMREAYEAKVNPEVLLAELRSLAGTIRQCQRNGHPDASKHLEALLTKLGA